MTVSKTQLLFAFGALLASGVVGATEPASEPQYSREYAKCMDKTNGVTFDMIECINAETKRQDARLNQNYKALMAAQTGKQRNALLAAQRAWIAFRDANCDFYYDPDGGTAARLAAYSCHLHMTASRADELLNLNGN